MSTPAVTPDFIPVAKPEPDFIPVDRPATQPPAPRLPRLKANTEPVEPTWGNAIENFSRGAGRFVSNAVEHPLDTLAGFVSAPGGGMYPSFAPTGNKQVDAGNQEMQRQQSADASTTGQAIRDNPAYAAGQAVLPIVAGAALGGPGKFKNIAIQSEKAPVSPIPPHEERIVKVVHASGVPQNKIAYLRDNLMGAEGNGEVASGLKHFAEKNNYDISNPYNAGEVAHQASEDAQSHFENNIRGPYENDRLRVAGIAPDIADKQGFATVKDIDNKISELTKMESTARIAEAAGNPTPMAKTSAQFGAEARALRNTMGKYLADRTGIPQDKLTNFRQYYGKLGSVADAFDQSGLAGGQREIAGKTGTTGNVAPPLESTGRLIVNTAVKAARGTPQYRLNKEFNSAMSAIPAKEYPYPQPTPQPAPPAPAPLVGRAPTLPPTHQVNVQPPLPEPDVATAQKVMAERIAARSKAKPVAPLPANHPANKPIY